MQSSLSSKGEEEDKKLYQKITHIKIFPPVLGFNLHAQLIFKN